MIRINLLPVSERKKTRTLKLPSFSASAGPKALWAVVAGVLFLGMIGSMAMLQAKKVKGLKVKIATWPANPFAVLPCSPQTRLNSLANDVSFQLSYG